MNVIAPKPVSREFALKLVKHVEDIFARGDVEAILNGYTDDIVIQFADIPEIRGKVAAEKFLRARFARQRNYRLRKDLRMLEGNMMGNYWDGEWEDTQSSIFSRIDI
jgi:nuclear transport factor 2 (NTF2) superfamily protein